MHAVKLSISEDKPIMMDYWVNSLQKTALIGVREANNERFLVKSEVEYTSPIAKLFNTDTDFIIMTENSIYIVDDKIQRRKIA
jgi:nicotinamide mononucleotide adenylyltransferase